MIIAAIFFAATLMENAVAITNAAEEIDAAIVAKGGTLVNGGGLRNAAAGILTIPTGGVIEPLAVTTNGVYYAPAGVDGFNPVTVTPPPEVIDIGGYTPYVVPASAAITGATLYYIGADGEPLADETAIETVEE